MTVTVHFAVTVFNKTYRVHIMIKSALRFDDIGVVPGLLLGSKVKYAAKITELERAWG